MAVHDVGTDAFLKCWFAFETLAMPDTTDIRPLQEMMAEIYGIPVDEGAARFRLGRLYGRRGRIVHDGDLRPVDARLQRYVEAVFVDVLRHRLGVPSALRAAKIATMSDFDLDQHL